MNFQQLRFVIAIADTGSFTRAADLCCVTQPALSNAVSQLEQELGGRLFERTTRSISITSFGDALLDQIRAIVDARVRLLTQAADHLARDDKTVRVGLSPLISSEFVSKLLNRSERLDPDLNIIVTEMNKADIGPALQGGAIDYGLCPAPLVDMDLSSVTIYREPLLLVSDQINTPTAEPVKLPNLADQTLLLVQDNCGLSDAVRILFRDNNVPLEEYEGRALGYHVLEKWARMGIGVTMLPASKVSEVSAAQPISLTNGSPAIIAFNAYWLRGQESRPSYATMAACLMPS